MSKNKGDIKPKRTQESIMAYVVDQPNKKLLRSKDGLKQGKLDVFMKPKSQCKKTNLTTSGKKRQNASTGISPLKAKRMKEAVLSTSDIENVEISNCKNDLNLNVEDVIPSSPVLVKTKKPLCQVSKSIPFAVMEMPQKTTVKVCSNEPEVKIAELKVENTVVKDQSDVEGLAHEDSLDDSLLAAMEHHSEDAKSNITIPKSLKVGAENPLAGVRFVVKTISYCQMDRQTIKEVTAVNASSMEEKTFKIKDDWQDLNLEVGDVLNILQDGDGTSPIDEITYKDNLLIHHPDTLISGTALSNSLGCLRRSLLNERFKNTELVAEGDQMSNVMLVGTIVHAIFQHAVVQKKIMSLEMLNKLAEDLVSSKRYLSDMLTLNTTPAELMTSIQPYIHNIYDWIRKYQFTSNSKPTGSINMNVPATSWEIPNAQKGRSHKFKANIKMTEVQDIEENVWSPRFGLKGKIDVTGSFKVEEHGAKVKRHSRESIFPLEIKTGKDSNSMEHRTQVATYSIFCDERRNSSENMNSLPAGILLYLKTGSMTCVPLKRTDKVGVVMLRNKVADYMCKTVETSSESSGKPVYVTSPFPPTISDIRTCGFCSQLRNCSLLHHSVDKPRGVSISPDLEQLMAKFMADLKNDDLAYFHHWMTCIFLESRESERKNHQLRFWLKTPQERCSEGSCVNNLVLTSSRMNEHDNYYLQVFKRTSGFSPDMTSTFAEGESVFISGTEPQFVAMATGHVVEVTPKFISVNTTRDLSKYPAEMTYSLDRHVWMSQISLQSSLSNLSILMSNNDHCQRLRDLIISHREPTFRPSLNFLPKSCNEQVASMLRGLNRTQRQAIKRVLLSNDYTLVVGMPGSGKTTTIVAMIRILLLCGLRVLVSSYTHSAVDNLLIKLLRYKVDFLRLGQSSSIHPTVQPYSEVHLSRDFVDASQLKELYDNAKVVGCTCLAVSSHPIFQVPGKTSPIFDVTIVDEASQISQPACLSPLVHSKRFVLVGDHKQLPPLVVSNEARAMGADESLFRRLTSHRSALCELTLQYRMNSDIMALSNHVTYEGRLECAHPSVATATVNFPNLDSLIGQLPDTDEWLSMTLNPDNCVIMLDTSKCEKYEEEVDKGIKNIFEAEIISRIIDCLLKAGCKTSQIGVIAPFRMQLNVIKEQISNNGCSGGADEIEVSTVDKFQGRDKNVILLSFVRAKPHSLGEKKGELLNDWRRLNVALTRAKHKLVMVGCARSLFEYEPCQKLIGYLRENGMIVDL